MVIEPQAGKQEEFLSCPADIVIFGGAAGGGKTFGILLEAVRHTDNPKFGAVIFRRESSQIANEGGPWDTALDLYSPMGAKFVSHPRYLVRFPKGSKVTFSHMQHEKHMKQWDGSQIPLVIFDELQHFTERQFWYMLSRNRSTCGVKPYVRATCNPDPDSFLVSLLEWWIDQKTGDPIPERSGIIRWLVRIEGKVHWADSKDALIERFGEKTRPKSFTFIMSSLEDNPALLEADPDYESNIEALLDYEKKRLKGNWFARPSEGELFKRHYFKVIEPDEVPYLGYVQARYWDRAGTVPNDTNPDPDFTAGGHVGIDERGRIYILNVVRDRMEPYDVEQLIRSYCTIDSDYTKCCIEQDPGQAGKMEANYYLRQLSGHNIEAFPKNKNKLAYWTPLACQAKAGNVYIVKGHWNEDFLREAEGVTDGSQKGHDDQVDAVAGAFMVLSGRISSVGLPESINVY